MKHIATLILGLCLVGGAFGESVLICHAQSVPASLGKSFRSPLVQTLVDGVFDHYFSRGDIAFDTAFSLDEGVPSSAWLASLTDRFGADRVVYVQVIWRQGPGDQAVLDRVDYQVVAPRGLVLGEGSFTADLVSPSVDEGRQVRDLTARVLVGLGS